MWKILLVFGIPLIFGGIMCYDMSRGIPPPNKILVIDEKRGELKFKKTYRF